MANPGRVVWYELLTSDPKAAIEFYTHVIGWKTQAFDSVGDYTMWVTEQGPVGGVGKLPDEAAKMGAQPYWQANVEVADINATVAKVKDLGGKVFHQEKVPAVGELAVIADPQGAVIAVFQPESEMKAHDLSKPGEFAWHELYTSDKDAALGFYNAIAGWEKLGQLDMGPMGVYVLWGREGTQLGGMMNLPPGMKTPDGRDVPPSWMYYTVVADLDAAIERAKARGAKVLNGPMPVPGGQRVVMLMDPQGAAFALSTPPVA